MGGKSKSSSATSTTTNTTAIDRRVVADNGALVIGDGGSANISNTVTDFGAIEAAKDVALASVIGSAALADKSTTAAGQIATSAFNIASGSIAELSKAYKQANEQAQDTASGNRTLAMVALGALGLGIAYAVSKN